MKRTTLTVIGEPLVCGVGGCYEPAVILLRQVADDGDEDHDAQLLYCETCWIATCRAFTPLTGRDEQAAVRETTAILRGERHE